GYVGCSYVKDQIYSSPLNTVLDTFTVNAKNLDMDADYNLQAAADTVHITVNNEKVDLVGQSTLTKHWDADSFDMTISWIRNSPFSNFAVQFDFGL
ncbi:hypothetical protein PFISCL1PPCAC_22526, partial [Pristionchus fissidentatus]